MIGGIISSQSIPLDSMYLGQALPGTIPIVFNLPVSNGLRPVERITFSSDGKEIYYSELNKWPATEYRIKCFKYNGTWQGPIISFEGFMAPALSVNDSIIYMQKNINNIACTYYSTRNDTGWSIPARLFSTNVQSHYFQETQSKNYFLASNPNGNSDLCKLIINNTDTIIQSLGSPINKIITENDFFIARDESYIIFFRLSSPYDLFISYNNGNGRWTNPKTLGININTAIYECCPYITHDKKHLFFTRGGDAMPTYYTYWVKIDELVDSLKKTNYVPYVYNLIPNQTDTIGKFFNYTVPDSTFIDDDGNNTLIYSAKLTSGSPLPAWLAFDSISCNFSGYPPLVQTLSINVTAKDAQGIATSTSFKLFIKESTVSNQIYMENKNFVFFPNPSKGVINITTKEFSPKYIIIEIRNMEGKIIHKDRFKNEIQIDLSAQPKGVYLIKIVNENEILTKSICLE